MSTLSYTETFQRIGYTTVAGVKIVQYTCVIQANDPTDMRISITKLDPIAYKANRDICRADFAEFEDAAYKLQEELLAKIGG